MRQPAALLLALLSLLFVSPLPSLAHSGGTDAYGCHNCYTSQCAGEYHCHTPKTYRAPVVNTAPRYSLPAPSSPSNIDISYEINGCAYDLRVTWDGNSSTDRYSVLLNQYYEEQSDTTTDTTSTSYIFKSVGAGEWYVHVRGGNSERWAGERYRDYSLRPIDDTFKAFVKDDQLIYDVKCVKKYGGPQFMLDHIKKTGEHSGSVQLPYTTPVTIGFSYEDQEGEGHTFSVDYAPTPVPSVGTNQGQEDGEATLGGVIMGASAIGGVSYLVKKKFFS